MRRLLLALGTAVFITSPLIGCGPSQEGPTLTIGPRIAGLNLNGKWYSEEFGYMTVIQDKNSVRGMYEDPRGPDHNGRFVGKVQGDLLTVDWIKPGNSVAAVFPRRGKAWLRIRQKGKRLEGMWGFDESRENGGKWTAEKSQYN